jgi:hypothetical protein
MHRKNYFYFSVRETEKPELKNADNRLSAYEQMAIVPKRYNAREERLKSKFYADCRTSGISRHEALKLIKLYF